MRLISQPFAILALLGPLLGCTDAASSGVPSSSSAASARASGRVFSRAELAWDVTPMPPGHPLGVTGAAIRSAVELDGEIAVVFYRPNEKMLPEKQASKVLELMRPSFTKTTKVAVMQVEKQGESSADGSFVFMHRGTDWAQDATAEESALVQTLLRDVPAGAPPPPGE